MGGLGAAGPRRPLCAPQGSSCSHPWGPACSPTSPGASPRKGFSACTFCWAGPGTGAACSALGPVRAALKSGQ